MRLFSRWFKRKPLALPYRERPSAPDFDPNFQFPLAFESTPAAPPTFSAPKPEERALADSPATSPEPENNPSPGFANKAHIIVFANEKGGVGKSTTAFHICVALCNAGERVAALDVDLRQLTMDRALTARTETARDYGIELPGPRQLLLAQSTEAEFETRIRMAQIEHDFIVIDVGGHDSPIARRAIYMADTIVTPVNDSFIDLDMLGRIDPRTGELRTLGAFARLVAHLKEPGLAQRARPLDWVVMQNRSRSLATRNERKIREALERIAPEAGFRLIPGLHERVIYRELFPFGLTLFDLEALPELGPPQKAAQKEIAAVIASLNLPTRDKKAQAPARQAKPYWLHDFSTE